MSSEEEAAEDLINLQKKNSVVDSVENHAPAGGPNVIGNAADLEIGEGDSGVQSLKNGDNSEENVLLSSQDEGESSTGFLNKIMNESSSKKAKENPQQKKKDAKEKEEFDQIVKMFSHDMQQVMRRHPASSSRGRKIPRYIQAKIGEATNLYAFGRFDEAIPLFEQVIKEMPELADITHTMSQIYQEKGDLEKAFMFAFLSANETRTDSEKWLQCADLSIKLDNYKNAIYCYNRAAKALNEDTQFFEILEIKMQKIGLYMKKRDYISITRTVDKQIKLFQRKVGSGHSFDK